jgi:outer membrane receptor protein involved in Fe transport
VPGDLEIFAGVDNLLDETYVSYIYYGGYYPAPGRSWRVGGYYRY